MKISSREKILLGILAAIALLALSYYVLFKPQMEKIAQLALENATLKQEVEKTEMEVAQIPKLETKLAELETSVAEKTKRFYPEILQDRIILIIDDIIKKSQLDSPASTYGQIIINEIQEFPAAEQQQYPARVLMEEYAGAFSVQQQEKPEGNADEASAGQPGEKRAEGKKETAKKKDEIQPNLTQNISVTLQFNGSYQQALRLVKEVEALDRTVVISDLVLGTDEQAQIAGNINIIFYGLPKMKEQDREYLEWPYNNNYGKVNPFVK